MFEIFQYDFMINALIASVLASIAFGMRKNYRDYFYHFLANGHFMKGEMDSARYYCDKYIQSSNEDFYDV